MNPAGLVLVIAGTWVVAQVFGGNALQRLKVLPGGTPADQLPAPATPSSSGQSGLVPGAAVRSGSGGGSGGAW